MKPKYKRVSKPDEVDATVLDGKYRDHLPHWTQNNDGSLIVEIRDDDWLKV